MDTSEIKKMSVLERLQAIEALWNSLLDEETDIESPEWHQDILEERKRRMENGEADFITIRELKSNHKS